MAGYIGQVNISGDNYRVGSTLFAVLDTDISNQGSITTSTTTNPDDTRIFNVPLDGFVLTNGVTIHIQFKQTWTGAEGVTIIKLKVGTTDAKVIENPNGAKIWYAGSVVSFTYDGTSYIMNTVGFDVNGITIDAGQLTNLSLGNITNNGTLIGHPSSLVVTDSNAAITGGVAFSSNTDGTYLDNTGTWSTPDKGVISITLQTTSPLIGGSSTATTSTGTYTIGFDDATANHVLAGPTSGSADIPTFRALVTDDIPNTIARVASPTFTGTPLLTNTPSSGDNSHAIADTAFVIAEINSRLASNDAMIFKGTIGTGGNPGTLPTTDYKAGWTYRVNTAGTYASQECEIGDLLIAVKDYQAATASTADWTVAQTNIDGSIYMENNTLTTGQIIIADGANGKVKTSGYTVAAPTAIGDILYASNTTTYNVLSVPSISPTNKVLTLVSDGNNVIPTWADAQHYTTHLYVNATSGGAESNATVTSGSIYMHLYDTSTKRETIEFVGNGGTTISASNAGVITISSKQYQNGTSAYAFTGLSVTYNDGNTHTDSVNANTDAQIGYVHNGVLYIKSIKYSTTEVITGINEI